jgi:hypothetical protein
MKRGAFLGVALILLALFLPLLHSHADHGSRLDAKSCHACARVLSPSEPAAPVLFAAPQRRPSIPHLPVRLGFESRLGGPCSSRAPPSLA